METFSTLLAIYAGNLPVTGEFPAQRPVTRSFEYDPMGDLNGMSVPIWQVYREYVTEHFLMEWSSSFVTAPIIHQRYFGKGIRNSILEPIHK